ncbi:ribonuclease PH [Thiohalorhabdus methylotrophus]|uniref:Ribonuclease PH n=1 Tax=Thiohalorhabdus methylotrophus TaxID=3242694 RepID=A0ABV4TTC3_9GAMM
MRSSGRPADAMRNVRFERRYIKHAEGSVLVSFGDTRVLCNASVMDRVPPWLVQGKSGWVHAEYAMLPRATHQRSPRESLRGQVGGRTHEIQRLIARSLRAAVDLRTLGKRQIVVDCDVLQADGGTRTAAITGGFLALRDAVDTLLADGTLSRDPVRHQVASVSAGIVDGEAVLDLDYDEDSSADVDMNFVLVEDGRFVEVQGTGEATPFSQEQMDAMRTLAEQGARRLFDAQRAALEEEPVG